MAGDRMAIWRGISRLDGVTPLVVLATGVPKMGKASKRSANAKTGDMIQVWILDANLAPTAVIRNGQDGSICGTCPHKSKASGGDGGCYVNVGQGPLSLWRSHVVNGSLPFDLERFRGQKVRFGAYGDPAAVPLEVWDAIGEVADGVTGYTHQWRSVDAGYKRWCMASVESIDGAREAVKLGYRLFFARPLGLGKPKGMVTCPASVEAGRKTVCATCMACGGTSNGRRTNITIQAHGSTASSFSA